MNFTSCIIDLGREQASRRLRNMYSTKASICTNVSCLFQFQFPYKNDFSLPSGYVVLLPRVEGHSLALISEQATSDMAEYVAVEQCIPASMNDSERCTRIHLKFNFDCLLLLSLQNIDGQLPVDNH